MPIRDPEKFRTSVAIAIILAGAITALLTKKKTRQTLFTMLAGWAGGVLAYLVCYYDDKSQIFTLTTCIIVTGSISSLWARLPGFVDDLVSIYQKNKTGPNDSL